MASRLDDKFYDRVMLGNGRWQVPSVWARYKDGGSSTAHACRTKPDPIISRRADGIVLQNFIANQTFHKVSPAVVPPSTSKPSLSTPTTKTTYRTTTSLLHKSIKSLLLYPTLSTWVKRIPTRSLALLPSVHPRLVQQRRRRDR